MREEPVLYINGNPYVVREASKPFANLEITGKPMQERRSPQYLDPQCSVDLPVRT